MESLAVKYRPKRFEEVVGQNSTVTILTTQVKSQSYKNAYLFCGSSGSGKTTVARIFANEINQYKGSPIEIDAASNSGVDNVREIVKSAKERSLTSQYKIFIIDEAHSISSQGWQAFLKCIEEPPMYTIFIFCTTDPQKLPSTIINRCQKFTFTRLPLDMIENRLRYICEMEHFVNYNESLSYIAKITNGGMRDAITTLEKCASLSIDLSIHNVLSAVGEFSFDVFFKLLNNLIDGNVNECLSIIQKYFDDGYDLKFFVDQFLRFLLDIGKYILGNTLEGTKIPHVMEQEVKYATSFDNPLNWYTYAIDKVLSLKNMIKQDNDPKTTIDVVFMQIARCQ